MKRKTKEQREAEQKAALRQLVDDLFTGAVGYEWDNEGEPWPEDFMNFVQACRRVFEVVSTAETVGNEWLWELWALDKFRNPETATEHLYKGGVRA